VLTRAQWLRFHAAAAVVDQYSSESEPLLTVVERDAIE
jgi:hypothetical protein